MANLENPQDLSVEGVACDLVELEAKPYDFRRPSRISRDRLLNIEAICDRLSSSASGFMSGRLRTGVFLNLERIDQLSFSEYISNLPKPCNAFVYYLGDEVACYGVLNLETTLPFYIIDRLFGGRGEPFKIDRTLSELERQALRQVLDRFFKFWSDAWRDHVKFEPVFSEFETMPEVLDIANRDDPVVILRFSMNSDDNIDGKLSVCVPLQALEEFLSASRATVTHARTTGVRSDEVRRAIDATLAAASVEVTVALPSFKMSVHDIMRVRSGDWIFTGVPLDRPVEIYVRNRLLFGGVVGRWNTLYGVQITENYVKSENVHLGLSKGFVMAKEDVLGIEEGRTMENGPSILGLSEHNVTSFDELGGLELPVVVVVGKKDMTLDEIRRLDRGSKFRLDRMVGQPADILVSNQLIAQGVIEEEEGYFAVRITSRPGISGRLL